MARTKKPAVFETQREPQSSAEREAFKVSKREIDDITAKLREAFADDEED